MKFQIFHNQKKKKEIQEFEEEINLTNIKKKQILKLIFISIKLII